MYEEERAHISELYRNGTTALELCAKYDMVRSSLYKWKSRLHQFQLQQKLPGSSICSKK
ncbi:helix-turn-helix domain-containing protein [Sinanaerobacter chloroacetimidivorans]|uniref:helix-turn-helix domain-containing protein n=1 Tax=Sinanaerobacter chloroacetimidivorans TaxID=2818044 RepID=UPI0038650906